MAAYYSENDAFASAWLRELIKEGVIAPGEVDERDIRDVRPNELMGFTQWHLFAGIGVWSYTLRRSGWTDDRPVLTASCPCQPYSAAGKGAGFTDERHLWPAAFHIIEQLRPPCIFGEQVIQAVKHGWWDLVADDLEGIDYSCWAEDFPACSVGAWHKRERLYFVADTDHAERRSQFEEHDYAYGRNGFGGGGAMGHSKRQGLQERERHGRIQCGEIQPSTGQAAECGSDASGVGDASVNRSGAFDRKSRTGDGQKISDRGPGVFSELDHSESGRRRQNGCDTAGDIGQTESREGYRLGGAGEISFWRDCEWIYCRDGKYRPIPRAAQPSAFEMADEPTSSLGRVCLASGVEVFAPLIQKGKARVGRLRGYGNAIVAEQAIAFIESYLESK